MHVDQLGLNKPDRLKGTGGEMLFNTLQARLLPGEATGRQYQTEFSKIHAPKSIALDPGSSYLSKSYSLLLLLVRLFKNNKQKNKNPKQKVASVVEDSERVKFM